LLYTRMYGILTQGIIASIVVLYFACFGLNPSFLGAFRDMFSLVSDTIRGRNLTANYFGITWNQVLVSVRLVVMSILLSLVFGILFSLIRIRLRKRPFTWIFQLFSAALESIPEPMYVVAVVVLVLYLINRWNLHALPVFQSGSPSFADTILPALTLALPGAFYLERVLYISVREEVDKPYVSTAMSKGLSARSVFYKHVLPNGWAIVLRQMPVVVSIVSSSALFIEFFMGYEGVLYKFTFAVGWNMTTGYYQAFEKPFNLPLYQPGLVFLIALVQVVLWVVLRMIFESMYISRFGRAT